MNGPYDRPRVYINWSQVLPKTLRGWTALVGFFALAFVGLAVFAFIASTLFAVALIVALIAAIGALLASLVGGWRRPRREVEPYRGNDA